MKERLANTMGRLESKRERSESKMGMSENMMGKSVNRKVMLASRKVTWENRKVTLVSRKVTWESKMVMLGNRRVRLENKKATLESKPVRLVCKQEKLGCKPVRSGCMKATLDCIWGLTKVKNHQSQGSTDRTERTPLHDQGRETPRMEMQSHILREFGFRGSYTYTSVYEHHLHKEYPWESQHPQEIRGHNRAKYLDKN